MAQVSNLFPQLSGDLFLTDGGIETTLIYKNGLDLPNFAAFVLLNNDGGRQILKNYFSTYVNLAEKYKVGIILESATWRASSDWGKKLGYSISELDTFNKEAIKILFEVRRDHPQSKIVISGCLGPRGDGYNPRLMMRAEIAESYHSQQIKVFKDAGVDLASAITMNYTNEAIGIARAAKKNGLPVVVSFTVETDGRLPTGETLKDSILKVDEATSNYPAYYMINCAHPTHITGAVNIDEEWAKRIRGIRVNASTKSHAELDRATELDDGNPQELGYQCARLKEEWPNLTILGGCCGTDDRHIEEIAKASLSLTRA